MRLQEWLAQKEIDWLLSDQIASLYCIAAMLKELHSKELVLCDMSPTTIAWCAPSPMCLTEEKCPFSPALQPLKLRVATSGL